MVNYRVFFVGSNLLTILTVIGVGVGLGLGIGLRSSNGETWIPRNAMYLSLPGDLFLRTLSCLMLPLIVSSLITAIGSLDLRLSKRIGVRGLVYYLSTSLVAAIFGCVMVHFISPGTQSGGENNNCGGEAGSTIDTLLDLLRNAFPPNIIGSTIQNTRTTTTRNDSLPFEEWPVTVGMVDGTNMLGVIVFSLVLGITLGQIGEAGRPLLKVFSSLSSAMLAITRKLIWAGPVSVIFLISGSLVSQDNINDVFSNLSWYIWVMVVSYLFHGFVTLPVLYSLLTQKLPFRFIQDIAPAIFSAFGTASSSATLPITLDCLEKNHKMDTRITRFLIPIGATVNMDGAAIGVPLRVIYIAQLCGRSLSFGELVTIALTSLAASVGLAGIPGVAMIVTITILGSMGLPQENIAYVLPVDWLQDRIGTVVNVVGDAYGAGIIGYLSRFDLQKVPTISPSDKDEDKNGTVSGLESDKNGTVSGLESV